MCGICGGNYALEVVQKASVAMRHRGLDAKGSFSDEKFSFAHNRLSIIDLQAQANQPFISPHYPHFVLVFNGDIYNYLDDYYGNLWWAAWTRSYAAWHTHDFNGYRGHHAYAVGNQKGSVKGWGTFPTLEDTMGHI